MKKLVTLAFTAMMLLGSVTVSMAAPVTIGGNLRTWIQYSDNDAGSTDTTFAFERFALDVNADLGKSNGIKNELQIRSLKTSVANDLRFESVYYQKNVLMKGDEFDIGAFGLNTFMPFKNGYSNAMVVVGGLGGGLSMSNIVGAMYSYNQPKYDFALGIANNRPFEDWNVAGEGVNTSMRVNFKPITGLKIGAGYENVANKTTLTPTTYIYDDSYNSDKRLVVDASYSGAPWGGIIEYVTDAPLVNGVHNSNLAAIYGELGYKTGALQLYAGRGVNTEGNLIRKINLSNAGSLQPLNNNYTVVGSQYTLPSGLIIGLEYVDVQDGGYSIGLRCRANF